MNIVKDYQWAVSREKKAREQVPLIILKEYKQNVGYIEQQFKMWASVAKSAAEGYTNGGGLGAARGTGGSNAYKNLYVAEPTGNEYILPFYTPYHHTITNNWGVAGGPIGEFLDAWLVPVMRMARPSAGIEYPKAWQGTTPQSYQFTFDLLNTIAPDENIEKNNKFIKTIINANLHEKETIITQIPPSIYEVEIPGVRYSPASFISNLTVENVGQVNLIEDENIPDAYRLTIQITELLIESKSIYNEKPKVLGSVED